MITVTNVLVHRHEDPDAYDAVRQAARWCPVGMEDHAGRRVLHTLLDGDETSHRRACLAIEYLDLLTDHYENQAREAWAERGASSGHEMHRITGVLIAASEEALPEVAAARAVFEQIAAIATPRPDKKVPA